MLYRNYQNNEWTRHVKYEQAYPLVRRCKYVARAQTQVTTLGRKTNKTDETD